MRSGAMSVAVIEPERSIVEDHGRLLPRHGLGDLRPRDADDERRQREQGQRRRHVPPPARRRGDDVLEQREVREAHDVACAAAAGRAGTRAGRARRARAPRARSARRSSSPPPFDLQELDERLEPVARGREHDVRDAERAQLARDLVAVGRGELVEALPQLRAARVDAELTAGLGSTSQRSPRSGSACSRGSRISTAITSWRASSRRSSRAASRAGRGSPRRRRRPSAGGRGGRAARARRRATSRPTGSRSGSRRSASRSGSTPEASLPRRRGRRGAVAEGRDGEPVAATRGEVPDRDRDALGHVPLAPVGGAERHRGGRVEHEPGLDRALGDVQPHVRLAGAGGHVPVDAAHVVAELVRPYLRELGAVAERPRAVVAGEQVVDALAHGQLEVAQERARSRAGAGPGGRAGGASSVWALALTPRPRGPGRGAASRRPRARGRAPRRRSTPSASAS